MLAAPFATAAQCGAQGRIKVSAQHSAVGGGAGFIATGAQLASEVEGSYALSNGRRLELVDVDHGLAADFDRWTRVELDEIGPHRFASREGDIEMTWVPGPRTDTILLSYPADSKGRLKRSC
jgi:hypothetical protein